MTSEMSSGRGGRAATEWILQIRTIIIIGPQHHHQSRETYFEGLLLLLHYLSDICVRDAAADLVLLSVEVMSSGNDGESGEGTSWGDTRLVCGL